MLPITKYPATGLLLLLCAGVATSAAAQTTRAASRTPVDARPVWPDEGPARWAPRPTTTAITPNDLRTRLYPFSDDSMMGRRIGEPGNYVGTAYIAREFARLGLKPAGDNGTYFQNLDYGPMRFDSAASRLIAGGTALGPMREWLPIVPSVANGFGATADLTDVPTVFAGRWG